MLVWLASMCIAASGPAVAAQPDPRCVALIDALERYEASISCLRWHERQYGPPSAAQGLNQWVLSLESERFVSQSWAYFMDCRVASAPPPDFAVSYERSTMFGNGSFVAAWDHERQSGSLANADPYMSGGPNVWRLMGRYCEPWRPMTAALLSAQLRSARELTWLEPTAEEPWPGLLATGAVNYGQVDVELRLDPDHGFAPRVINLYGSHPKRFLYEALITVEYTSAGGTWLPRVGLQASNYAMRIPDAANPLTEARRKDFELGASLVGLPDDVRSPELARWIGRFEAVHVLDAGEGLVVGPFLVFQDDESTFSPQVVVASGFVVNVPMTLEEMLDRLPAEGSYFDCTRLHRVTREQLSASIRQVFTGDFP
jgi:hypothetical protein